MRGVVRPGGCAVLVVGSRLRWGRHGMRGRGIRTHEPSRKKKADKHPSLRQGWARADSTPDRPSRAHSDHRCECRMRSGPALTLGSCDVYFCGDGGKKRNEECLVPAYVLLTPRHNTSRNAATAESRAAGLSTITILLVAGARRNCHFWTSLRTYLQVLYRIARSCAVPIHDPRTKECRNPGKAHRLDLVLPRQHASHVATHHVPARPPSHHHMVWRAQWIRRGLD